MKESATPAPPRTLLRVDPPPRLSAFVHAIVHRDDPAGGGVMRLLPELRCSIQVTRGDRYWTRPRDQDRWELAPVVALWGPKLRPGYGYARRHIRVDAIGLSALGLRALAGVRAGALAERIVDFSDIDAEGAAALAPRLGEESADWRRRVVAWLERRLREVPPADPLAAGLALLSTGEGDAVAQAARACGLSERTFRRQFTAWHGCAPKTWQRIARVDRMLRTLHASPWEDDPYAPMPVAFADQPHAIREFRAWTGLTPRAYWQAKRAGDATLRSIRAPEVAPPEQEQA
ncbi:MAG: AraC family transcriptional regulator [Xanthomonadales bacterium]|nr:AraC family transcriptional regulator [Xanthomonadales bacterium]